MINVSNLRTRRMLAAVVFASLSLAACSKDMTVTSSSTDTTDMVADGGADTTETTAVTETTGAAPATSVEAAPTTDPSVPTTTPAPAPTTTAAPAPPPTPAPAPPTTAAPAPPATPAPEPAPELALLPTSPSMWVVVGGAGEPLVPAPVTGCAPLWSAIPDGGFTVKRCGVWNALGGQRMWTVTKGASGRFVGTVWQQVGDNWTPVLRAQEPAAGDWNDLVIRTGNIDAGANDELVSGARVAGTGGYLLMEIVDIRSSSPRSVAVLPEAPKGIGVMLPGEGVELWGAIYEGGAPTCCPTSFLPILVRSTTGGRWNWDERVGRITGDPEIPISQF